MTEPLEDRIYAAMKEAPDYRRLPETLEEWHDRSLRRLAQIRAIMMCRMSPEEVEAELAAIRGLVKRSSIFDASPEELEAETREARQRCADVVKLARMAASGEMLFPLGRSASADRAAQMMSSSSTALTGKSNCGAIVNCAADVAETDGQSRALVAMVNGLLAAARFCSSMIRTLVQPLGGRKRDGER